MSKKNKFALEKLVHEGKIKEGEELCFISDPDRRATIIKLPNHEIKLQHGAEVLTVFQLAQKLLGTDPPDHASRWLRTHGGKTLYELWQTESEED